MKKISLILVLLFIARCNKKESEKLVPFFKFDEVIHYQVNDQDEVWKLLKVSESERTESGKNFYKILMEYNYPISLSNSTFLKNLETLYPIKNQIPKNLFSELSKIFSQSNVVDNTEYACEPFFRDIFIFKKNDKITGIAKICLECEKYYFVGANEDTQNFGSNGEFENLQKIIKKINPATKNSFNN